MLERHSRRYGPAGPRRAIQEDTMIEDLRQIPLMRPLLLACLTLVLGAPVPAVAQRPYDGIVVFGTSFSDTGNGFALVGGTNTPPDYQVNELLIPVVPYARGGHHLTNGATWVEQLARTLGLAGSVRPALRSSSPLATNYAVGAARARDDGANFNLTDQVNTFLQDAGGVAPSSALYVIEMGGNDIRDALVAFAQGQDSGIILQAAVMSIAQNIGTLYAAGARNFLVWTAPDVGLTPALRTLDSTLPGASAIASLFSQGFNVALSGALTPLAALPGIQISILDTFQLVHAIVASPGAFGLTDVTSPCITPGVPPFSCRNPDEFLFWDGIHPTQAVHAIVAQQAAVVLGLQ
jgi:phospholipase/lecithinase/hemolysin